MIIVSMKDNIQEKIKYLAEVKRQLLINVDFKFSKTFLDVPFTTSKDLNIINKHTSKKDRACVYFTSGTTGKPKAVYYAIDDINFFQNYISWMCKLENIPKGSTVAVLMDQSFWGIGYFTCLGHVAYGNKVVPIDTDLPNKNIREIMEIIKPEIISSLPSILIDKAKDLVGINFDFIETTGEILSIRKRKCIEKKYGGVVFDAYGLMESVIGVECSSHDGYHYNEDNIYLEIIDKSGKRISDNKDGEIIVSILSNVSRLLIRYKTGDYGRIIRTLCACGSEYPKVYISGRIEKTYFLYEGYKLEYKEINKIIHNMYGIAKNFKVKLSIVSDVYILIITIYNGSDKQNNQVLQKIQKLNFEMMHMVRNNKIKIYIYNK